MRCSVVSDQGEASWRPYVPDLPGCAAVGATRAEAEALIVEAIGAYLEGLRDSGQPLPAPRSSPGLVDVAWRPDRKPGCPLSCPGAPGR